MHATLTNQGWKEKVTGTLWSLKTTMAHMVTHKCSSTKTGMSQAVTCHQTWWRNSSAWPEHRRFDKVEKKYNMGLNLQVAYQRVPVHPSHSSLSISQRKVIYHLNAPWAKESWETVSCFIHQTHQTGSYYCFNGWTSGGMVDQLWIRDKNILYKNQVKSNVCPHVKILTNYYWP